MRASDFFSQRLRQHVLVERQIRHKAFQPGILVLDLPQPAQFAHAQVRVLLFPDVEGGLADAELPADIAERGPALGLADGVGDLLLGESDLFIGPLLSSRTVRSR